MVSLPTPDIVLAVATGQDGVIEGKRVRRFVDLSTTGAVMAKRIFELLKAKNIVQIDCPVSGGIDRRGEGHARADGLRPARGGRRRSSRRWRRSARRSSSASGRAPDRP